MLWPPFRLSVTVQLLALLTATLRLKRSPNCSPADIVAVQGVLSAGPERDVPVCEVQVRYASYGLVLSSDAVVDKVHDAFRGLPTPELLSSNLSSEQEKALLEVFSH